MSQSTQMLMLTGVFGLGAVSLLGIHKPLTGGAIRKLVPEWQVDEGALIPVVSRPRNDCLQIPEAPGALIENSAVQILYENGATCSGTLIGCSTILSARHCEQDGVPATVRFVGNPKQTYPLVLQRQSETMDLATYHVQGLLGGRPPEGVAVAPILGPETDFLKPTPVVIAGSGVTELDELFQKDRQDAAFRCGRSVTFREVETYAPSHLSGKAPDEYENGINLALTLTQSPDGHTNSNGDLDGTDPRDSALCPGDSGGATWAESNGQWGILGVNSVANCGEGYTARSWIADLRAPEAQELLQLPASEQTCL